MDLRIVHSSYEFGNSSGYELLEMKDVILKSYEVDNDNQDLTIKYIHTKDEYSYSKNEFDEDSFSWLNDKAFPSDHKDECGIVVDNTEYLVGDKTFDEYVDEIRPVLENVLTEQVLDTVN